MELIEIMKEFLKKTFTLDDEGARETIKVSLYNVLANITIMFTSILIYFFLKESIGDALNNSPVQSLDFWKYLGMAVFFFALITFFYYKAYDAYIYAYDESANKRKSLAERLRKLPLSFFAKKDLSDLSITLMNDTTKLEEIISHYIPPLIASVISTSIVVISITFFNFYMGLSFLWVVILAFTLTICTKKIQENLNKDVKAKQLKYSDKVQECIENIKDMRSSNTIKKHVDITKNLIYEHENLAFKAEYGVGILINLSMLILKVGIATSMLMACHLLLNGSIDILLFILFLLIATRIYDPLNTALIFIAALFGSSVSVKRMQELENTQIQEGKLVMENNGYDIVFDKVGFAYTTGKEILKDISFTAKQGSVTALVGASGSGKSTLLKLASRFWDISKGTISIGSEDISKVDPEELLKNISIVFQEVTLFDNSIMENIRIGRKDATDEEVIEAAKYAHCHEFVEKMPEGYNTMIGENGQKLSGGQRQRLSIARALLKDAPIILLDEATSSLDVMTEKHVQGAIKELIKSKTVIVIAHRMRTIVAADQIIYLENGQVNAIGNHEKLMKNCSGYANMINLQLQTLNWKL